MNNPSAILDETDKELRLFVKLKKSLNHGEKLIQIFISFPEASKPWVCCDRLPLQIGSIHNSLETEH